MKISIITLLSIIVIAVAARAESTVTLTGVHNCCKKCETGITNTVTKAGATAGVAKTAITVTEAEAKIKATVKEEVTTVTITASDEATAKKAVAALGAAGYFGAGMEPAAGLSETKAKSVTVEGVHLCCGKCVSAFNKAATAAGATKTDAVKDAKSVTVDGDISPKELLTALNKGGFNGKVK